VSPKLSEQEAEWQASEVLRELAIEALPVRPIAIAQQKEILIEPFNAAKPGIHGCLIKHGDQFGIGYANHLDNEGFINFTVGHELGHYFLPGHIDFLFPCGDSTHYSRSPYSCSEPHERQADCFSAALLMPEILFVTAIRKAGKGLSAVRSLAGTCKTSLTSTAIRYSQFTECASAIIVSCGNSVEYSFMSRSFEDISGVVFLGRGDELPLGCPTEKFNRDPQNIVRSDTREAVSYLCDWFPDAPKHEINEDIVGLGKFGKTLTVLFTENEIIGDDDDEEEATDQRFRRRGSR